MNAVVTNEDRPVSAQTLEHVLGTGDLSKLTTPQRVEYYARTCHTLGLNPLTRPFRFLALNGQIQLYATRDCTDQLRKVNGITLHVVDKQIDGDVFVVTVRARTKDGREDEDMGAVSLAQARGESRANALMKAMTKAKRRVTLSICGLGMTDEAELDTMPGAQPFDAEDDLPVAPIRAAAVATPKPERVVDPTVYETKPALELLEEPDSRVWLLNLERLLANATSQDEVMEISAYHTVGTATVKAPGSVKARVSELLVQAYARFAEEPDELPEVEIEGAEKLGAG
jgi:hypothetical protein